MNTFENTFVRDPSPNNNSDDDKSLPAEINNDLQKYKNTKSVSGYQQINQDVHDFPHGRNTFAFWTLVILLFVLTIGNLILTLTIIGTLRLGRGMENLELVPEAETVKFFGITDLDRIYKRDGSLEGFDDVPVTITGDNSFVYINLVNRNGHNHNKFSMGKNGTHFKGINQFEVKNSATGETIFTTHKPRYNLPKGVNNLKAFVVSASRITSPLDQSLEFESKGKINIRGTEGTSIKGKEILWSADQNIYLKSMNSSLIIFGGNGTYIDIKNIPIVSDHGIRAGNSQYKLCVCMPQGKLFRVLIPRTHGSKGSCAHISSKHDPCL